MTDLPSPFNGQLPVVVTVVLRQHLDRLKPRSWVEVLDSQPADQDRSGSGGFLERILANQPRHRHVTEELEGRWDPTLLLEQAFQNLLGVWPYPRRGLHQDLATLGYSLDWHDDKNTITPVTIRADQNSTKIG